MEKTNIEKYLLNDDTFFFCLLLMDYPKGKRNIFYFSDFANFRYKNLGKDELLIFFVFLRNYLNLELREPNDKKSDLWNLVSNNTLSDIRRFFKRSSQSKIEDIFDDQDFQIVVPKNTRNILRESLEEYIEDFTKCRLIKWQKNYAPFKKQKNIMLEKIENEIQDYKSNLVFCDTEIDQECKFFEIMFTLQRMGIIKIKSIINSENISENCFYKIGFFVNKEEFLREKYKSENKNRQDESDKSLNLIKTEPGITWADITIKLKENYNIEIKIKDTIYKTNHERMGFADRRNDKEIKTKKCWNFLEILSQKNGILTIKDENPDSKKKYGKRKQEISKILKKFFPLISGDPFEKYDEEKESYKIKIKIIPVENYDDDRWGHKFYDEITDKKDPYADIVDSYKDQTPSQ